MKKSVKIVPSISERIYSDDAGRSPTCHMLIEDLYLPVFPFQDEQQHLLLSIVNSASKPLVCGAVTRAFSEEHDSIGFARELGQFIRSAAQTAVTFGDASFELVLDPLSLNRRGLANDQPGNPHLFRVDSIMPKTVLRPFGRPIQHLPAVDAARGRRVIWLDPSRTFVLTLPGIGRHRWLHILEALAALDRVMHNAVLLNNPGFDFSEQQRLVRRSQLVVTRCIPWVQRGSLKHENMSEIYSIYKWLKMKRFVFDLRERIVSMMNDMLARAGRVKGFSATLETVRLPTAADADAAVSDLLLGRASPEALVRRFLGAV